MQENKKLKKRLASAKKTLLIVAVLTIVNTVLIAVNADISFTFSAYVPQLVAAIFWQFAAEEGINAYLYIGVAIAIFMSLIYLLLWMGAKKKNVFITVALVLFGIDTAIMLFDLISYFDTGYIIDIAFHAWVIYDLAMGIRACNALKKQPDQNAADPLAFGNEFEQSTADCGMQNTQLNYNPYTDRSYSQAVQSDSTPIGISESKGRAVISVDYNGMNVEVRRSKGLTELIVDGKVYAEKEGILETQYELYARVSGVEFSVVMTLSGVMYLYADGQMIAKKIRLV